jgi:hypothetical protein
MGIPNDPHQTQTALNSINVILKFVGAGKRIKVLQVKYLNKIL